MNITSRKNSKVLLYRNLLRERSERNSHGMFVSEGFKLCTEAIKSGLVIKSAFFTKKARENYPEFYSEVEKLTEIDEISEDLSGYVSDTKSPQGIFIAFSLLDKIINLDTIYSCTRLIILERLQDPGNIGTIIRSADAFGIDAVIISEECADVNSPKILRSAMGSAFRLPIYRMSIEELLPLLKENGFATYAAMLDDKAERLGEVHFPEKAAVIIGNEGNGISPQTAEMCTNKLYVPIKNAESLNAATAASIIMYEIKKNEEN